MPRFDGPPRPGRRLGGALTRNYSSELSWSYSLAALGVICFPVLPPLIGLVLGIAAVKRDGAVAYGAIAANAVILVVGVAGTFALLSMFR